MCLLCLFVANFPLRSTVIDKKFALAPSAGEKLALCGAVGNPGVVRKHVFSREFEHDAIFHPELVELEQADLGCRSAPEMPGAPTLACADTLDGGAICLDRYQCVE